MLVKKLFQAPTKIPPDHGDEWYADDEHVEKIEGRAAKGTVVQYETVRYHLQEDLDGEDWREEIIEVVQDL